VNGEERDGQLLRALYEEHGRAVLAFVRRNVADSGRAEDILQETMLRAWRRPDDLDRERETLLPYLLTVARNVIIDWWRRDGRLPQVVAGEDRLDSITVTDQVDQLLDEWLIQEALRRLSPSHQEILRELYFEGRSVDEAARRLSIPVGTVKSRSYYAVRVLRAVFEEMGIAR
jgi:RNA polymerase sigma-70 factor (ECF subfamily)